MDKQYYWDKFKETGNIDFYLKYKKAAKKAKEEK